MIQNRTKRICKNLIKQPYKQQTSYDLYISSNNDRHPVPKTFAALHYTPPKYTSLHCPHLHLTRSSLHCPQLHFTTLCPTTLHYTVPNYTSLHYTVPNYTSLHFTTLSPTTLHYTVSNCTSLHCSQLHFTPLHYTVPNYTSLHFTTLVTVDTLRCCYFANILMKRQFVITHGIRQIEILAKLNSWVTDGHTFCQYVNVHKKVACRIFVKS